MNLNKVDTNIQQKRKHFKKFSKLIENQFNHGGVKYEVSKTKELSDMICEMFPGDCGVDYVLGTIMKYVGRYKNFGREKDLLKIATYSYILWLKGEFYNLKKEDHEEDVKKKG